MVNEHFYRKLSYSREPAYQERMNTFYKRYFCNVEGIIPVGKHKQQLGYDKIVCLQDGNEIRIEEKRDTHTKTGNFAIETWSSVNPITHEKVRPGWIATSQCDYLSYCFDPTWHVYMLPFAQLQHAWRENWTEWVKLYRERPVQNGVEYYTLIVPVPITKVLGALKMAQVGEA